MLRDITSFIEGEWAATLSPAGVRAFTCEGKVYGAPMKTVLEILWFNKALLEKAKVDPASLATWSGFIDAVKKCKAAGIHASGHRGRRQVAAALLLDDAGVANRWQGGI